MVTYIALLRGINVGGNKKVLMVDLKSLFEKLGYSSIVTYIQSGNVVFKSGKKSTNTSIENELEEAIKKQYGFEVPVLVLTSIELEKTFASNPFTKKKAFDIERLHITFLKEKPEKEKLEAIQNFTFEPDLYHIIDQAIFVSCVGKYSDTKLTFQFFESKLKVPTTTRNWKTMTKLIELSQDI